MDRCALFVDAGYLLADGAMAVHGTRNRESVSWDFQGLVRLLNEIAHDRTGLPLLRCYWYEATVDGRRDAEQDGIADLPGVKVRAARIRPGRREGVENYVQRDITTLARSGVLCEAVLVSGDEDMVPVVADVQDLGVRVSVVQVAMDGESSSARELRRECDDLIEIGAGHLRQHVNLIAAPAEHAPEAAAAQAPMANGRPHGTDHGVERHPVAAHPADARMEPVSAGASGGYPAQSEGNAMEQLRAMQQSIAQRRAGGDHLAPRQTAPPMEPPGHAAAYGTGPQPSHAYPDAAAMGYGTGAQQSHAAYQHDGVDRTGGRPVPPGAPPPTMPAGGPHAPSGANPSMANPGTGAQPSMHPGFQHYGQPGAHPEPHSPSPPPPAEGHPPARGAPPGVDPRYGPPEDPNAGGPPRPNPSSGVSSRAGSGFDGAAAQRSPTHPATGPRPAPRPRHGPTTNPTPHLGPVVTTGDVIPGGGDPVEVARKEGNDFGASITASAPTLWVEAVLARRPAMPSDLEARLLQGSTLPVDFLLRDEVREALRDGFWRALERARG